MNTIAIVNHTSGVKKKLKGQKYSKLILYPSIKYKKTTIRYESKHIVNKYTLILSKTVFSFYRTDTISKYFVSLESLYYSGLGRFRGVT